MIVVGIETSTPHTSVAIGTEREILGRVEVVGKARQESVTPALEQLLCWTGVTSTRSAGSPWGSGRGCSRASGWVSRRRRRSRR